LYKSSVFVYLIFMIVTHYLDSLCLQLWISYLHLFNYSYNCEW